jgi:hypothetical protein
MNASLAQQQASQLYVGLTNDFTIIESNTPGSNFYNTTTVPFDKETPLPFFDIGNQNLNGIITFAYSKNYNVVSHDVFQLIYNYSQPGCVSVRITGFIKVYNYIKKYNTSTGIYNDLTTATFNYLIPQSSYFYNSIDNVYQIIIPLNTLYTLALDNASGQVPFNIGDKVKNNVQIVQQIFYDSIGTPIPRFEFLDSIGDPMDPDFGTEKFSLDNGALGSTMYALNSQTTLVEGDLLEVNNSLPTKIKQKEFLTSILRAFNLFVEVNPNNPNDLLIEPFDEFYNTTDIINYENRTDLNKEQTINPNLLEGKRYIYAYKNDVDYYNDLYQKTHNQSFGTEEINVDNDFVKSDKKIELIFSGTPLVANYGLGIAQPQIYKYENSIYSPIAANIRLLYCAVKTSPNAYTYKQQGEADITTNEYLHAGMEDDAMNPTVSLMFGPAKDFYYNYINAYFTTNNLYNKYHKQYLVNLIDRDAKFVTKYLWLTPKDINEFSFRNRLFIDGSYYIVNKIENYTPLEQTSTKVELIKLLDTEAFVPESILISDSSVNAGSEVYTARLNSSLNVGTNIQNRGTNCLAIGENIVIPESCTNLIVFGSNITADENSTGLLLNYKIYVALISQTGTSAPTVTILENTLGDIVWTRASTGLYYGTLTGAFLASKTFVIGGSADINAGGGDFATLDIKRLDNDKIYLYTYDNFTPADSLLVNTSIEIRVYN